ncbi:hypothetical protein [Candidatus Nanohalococcus occultus]|uniref:Uncharacterized protein n=1 Tax=Candidatus Nanohalococcus occultus TaxID=2978047 RepID=A0ABY8CFK9_9ARCH|nr:hypothetical protein SVXNc_1022 [Candidatus Nanohaloarchaeota archaeon SVXNc]
MSEKRSFSDFIYNIENIVDEFTIVALSFGFVVVTIWAFFFAAGDVSMIEFGKQVVSPWLTPLALMIIARELWLMNRNMSE